jgi:hypothetical protein
MIAGKLFITINRTLRLLAEDVNKFLAVNLTAKNSNKKSSAIHSGTFFGKKLPALPHVECRKRKIRL